MLLHSPLNSLSLSTQCTSYIVHRTSYIVHRCMVPWTLWVSVIKWSATDYTDQAEAIWVYVIAQPPELSESQYTMYIVHRTSHFVHRTSYIAPRTSYIVHRCMVPWALWVSVIKWPATDYTDQAKTMPVHDIAQPPELSESRDTLYIVHCTSYIARRTSHFVHCTSYIVHRCMLSQIEWVSYRLYWLGQNNVSPWYCTTPWTLRVSVHRTSTSYIVHRTSYIVHRTSYIVHRPSIVPPQDSSFRNHISALTASLETASMARTRSS